MIHVNSCYCAIGYVFMQIGSMNRPSRYGGKEITTLDPCDLNQPLRRQQNMVLLRRED